MFNCAYCRLRDLNNAARLELDAVLFVVEPSTMNKEEKDQKPRTRYRVSERVISGHRDQKVRGYFRKAVDFFMVDRHMGGRRKRMRKCLF
jgi:hypothetical protein